MKRRLLRENKQEYFEVTSKGKVLINDIEKLENAISKFYTNESDITTCLEYVLEDSTRVMSNMIDEIGLLYVLVKDKGYTLSMKNIKSYFQIESLLDSGGDHQAGYNFNILLKNGIVKNIGGY